MSYLGKVALKASDIRRLDVTSSTSATHTLTWTPPSEQSLIITINGVKQQNNYSISGVTLTLDTALVATDEMEVIGINDIGTTTVPGDGTVTSEKIVDGTIVDADINASADIAGSKLADNGVTLAKLEHGTQGDILYYGASGAPARLGFGTSGDFLKTQGTGANPVWATVDSSGFNSVQVFTSSGTWTRPSGITKVIIEVQGAGAGGSGANNSQSYNGMGGSGGGYARKYLNVSSISTSTITVGAGGAYGAHTAHGSDGGDSSWADGTNTISGDGGNGGEQYSNNRILGGTATGGDINIPGGDSETRRNIGGGRGGGATLGNSDAGVTSSGGGSAGTATGYGSGGGGGNQGSGENGRTGAPGIIMAWEFK